MRLVFVLLLFSCSGAFSQSFNEEYISIVNTYRSRNNLHPLKFDSVAFHAAKYHYEYLAEATRQYGKLIISDTQQVMLLGVLNLPLPKDRVNSFADDYEVEDCSELITIKGGWGNVAFSPNEVFDLFVKNVQYNEHLLSYRYTRTGCYYGVLVYEGILFIFVIQIIY